MARNNLASTIRIGKADDVRLDDILELDKFVGRYPDLVTESRLRWLIFNRRTNGIEKSGAVFKRYGRWHAVVPRYRDWLLRDDGA